MLGVEIAQYLCDILFQSVCAHVQGSFQVMAQQPINYSIEEVEGLLDPANKVRPPISLPWTFQPSCLEPSKFHSAKLQHWCCFPAQTRRLLVQTWGRLLGGGFKIGAGRMLKSMAALMCRHFCEEWSQIRSHHC